MKAITAFLILIIIFAFSTLSIAADSNPLSLIYQELKIGMERQKAYDIVGNYYPGRMAIVHDEQNNHEIWHWNWPPEIKRDSRETAYLGIEFFNNKISYAFYKYVSSEKIEIKILKKEVKK